MEYCVWFWSPNYGKNVIKLKKMQKGFTRMWARVIGRDLIGWDFFLWRVEG